MAASNIFGTTTSGKRKQDCGLALIAKVRIPDENAYKGEYGFDWIDINADDKDILKVQGVDFSNIEYFYKPPTANSGNDLGTIELAAGNESAVKEQIKAHYPDLRRVAGCNKFVDQPYILIKKDQEIELALRFEMEGTLKGTEKIQLVGNDAFDLEIVGGEKKGQTTQVNFSGSELRLKIACKENIQSQQAIRIVLQQEDEGETVIGGLVMMENTPLELTFRVIALVANSGNILNKVSHLFKVFKSNDILNFLNENSLNQAGYTIRIDNQEMFDNIETANLDDLDEYFYAFDRSKWTEKGLFFEGFIKIKNGVDWQKDVLVKKGLDDITIFEYSDKLKLKGYNNYNKGFIIITEFECEDDTGAYSQTIPLSYYNLVVYFTNYYNNTTYAHEIGHMLGLEHSFIGSNDLQEFDTYKNAYKEYSMSYDAKEKQINDIRNSNIAFYSVQGTICKINTLEDALNNFNRTHLNITQLEAKKSDNTKALKDMNTLMQKDYDHFNPGYVFWILKTDLIKIREDTRYYYDMQRNYYKKIYEQKIKNYLFFKKYNTKNIMDYDSDGAINGGRVFFTHSQTLIMRNDYENYNK